jgi:hypothetical protein
VDFVFVPKIKFIQTVIYSIKFFKVKVVHFIVLTFHTWHKVQKTNKSTIMDLFDCFFFAVVVFSKFNFKSSKTEM